MSDPFQDAWNNLAGEQMSDDRYRKAVEEIGFRFAMPSQFAETVEAILRRAFPEPPKVAELGRDKLLSQQGSLCEIFDCKPSELYERVKACEAERDLWYTRMVSAVFADNANWGDKTCGWFQEAERKWKAMEADALAWRRVKALAGNVWYSMASAPKDGTRIRGLCSDGGTDTVFWTENAVCMLSGVAHGAGSMGAAWMSDEARLYVDEPLCWQPIAATPEAAVREACERCGLEVE